MNKSQVAALLLALPLIGCVQAPSTKPSQSEITPTSVGLGSDLAPQPAADWWKAFNDPQLDRLVEQLLAGNPTLQGALARIRAAEAGVSAAESLQYPNINIDGTDTVQLVSKEFVYPLRYGGTWQWVGDVEGRLRWSLDFWGKQAALIERARNVHEAASLDAHAARLALAGQFAQSYVALLLAWQNIDIAHQTLDERQTILELTQSRVAAGLENEASLEQAKALLATARMEVRRTEAQRDIGVHAIAALLGRGADVYPSIARPAAAAENALPLPKHLPADLLSRRPDILAAHMRVRAAIAGREAAHADFYPNIDLTAALGFQAIGFENLFSGDALTAGVGPAIHLPVFDAGRLRAQYAAATADLDTAVADYNGAVVRAVRQTADALTEVESLADQRQQQKLALDSAARAFDLAKERYRLGLSGQIPMLTAESTLLEARRQMAALVAEDANQRVALLLAAGGGYNPGQGDSVSVIKVSANPKQDATP
ncbi:MAG TPA: efflux transporter outer membrane subunit [Rhizomicrobium sp.]|nr:efflux transporter outer membrane subunit [Rhizomicrobium sp.]